MRVMVKRLLKKYHYPPEGQEQALQTVMAQCNRWADDEGNFQPVINLTIENHYHGTIDNLTINEGNKGFTYPQVDESDVVGMAAEDIN
jgi:hypothetical protein